MTPCGLRAPGGGAVRVSPTGLAHFGGDRPSGAMAESQPGSALALN
jgi:hypothetical protein